MQTQFPNASDFRAQARKVLKPNLNTAAVVIFLASLPGLISSTVTTLATQDVRSDFFKLLLSIYTDTTMTSQTMIDRLTAIAQIAAQTPAIQISAALSFVVFLITPFLTLGLMAFLMKLLRGEIISAGDLLCRRRCFLKGIGLTLYVALREFLWALPGLALTVASIPALAATQNLTLFEAMYFGGILLMAVLGVRAALHYSQADMLMADRPEAGIRDCVHDSWIIMRHRKKYLLLLYVSFIGWYFGAYLIENLLADMNYVVCLLVQMIFDLGLSLYLDTSLAAFYIHYEKQPDAM